MRDSMKPFRAETLCGRGSVRAAEAQALQVAQATRGVENVPPKDFEALSRYLRIMRVA